MIYYTVLKDISFAKKPLHVLRALLAKYLLAISSKTVIGVTGSVGKTTTTNTIRCALAGLAISTSSNLDSIFNIPITILKSFRFRYLVLEMGVQYPQDMEYNVSVAPVDVAVFTKISPAHTKFLKDTNGIFFEKTKIITPKTKLIVFNFDDPLQLQKFRNSKIKTISYGFSKNADVSITINQSTLTNTSITLISDGKKYLVSSRLIGKHQAYSVGAAFAVGKYFKIHPDQLITNIEKTEPANNRFNLVKIKQWDVIKDIYNSSPQALSDAIEFVKRQDKRQKIIIIGDMLELGEISTDQHLIIAKQLLAANFDQVFTYGSESKKIHDYLSKHHSKSKLVHLTKPFKLSDQKFDSNSLILIKGSHGMHMENFL